MARNSFQYYPISFVLMRSHFLLILLFPLIGLAQPDNINKVDEKGRKQGAWKKSYPSGVVRYTGQFKDDKPIGTFQYFSEFGKKTSEISYKQDTGFATFFHVNGEVMGKGIYINRAKQGTWMYWDNNGILSSEEEYKNDKLINTRKVYYAGGGIARTEPYQDGLINGKVQEFFEEGQLKYEANYIDGNPDSTVNYFHPNGNKRIVGRYKDAVRHGKWIYYDENAKITHWEFYKLGELIKTIKREED